MSSLNRNFSKVSVAVRFSLLALLILVCVGGASGAVQDGFEDGDFTSSPFWNTSKSDANATVQSSTVLSDSKSLEVEVGSGEYIFYHDRGSQASIAPESTFQFEINPNSLQQYRYRVTDSKPTEFIGGENEVQIVLYGDGDVFLFTYDESGNQIESKGWTTYSSGNEYRFNLKFYPGNSTVYAKKYDNSGNLLDSSTGANYSGKLGGKYVTFLSRGGTSYWDDVTYSLNSPPQFNSTSHNDCLIGESCDYGAEVFDSDGSISYTNLTLSYGGSTVVVDEQRTGTTSPVWNDIYTPQTGNKWLNATLEVVDDQGAVTTTEINRYLSDTAPEFSITEPSNTTYTTPNIPYELDYQDDGDSNPNETGYCELYNDGGLVSNETVYEQNTTTLTGTVNDVTAGSHTFESTCYEDDDGQSTTKSIQYSNENGPPQINSFTASPSTDWQKGEEISFSYDINDGFDNITYVNLTAERDGTEIANRETNYDSESVTDSISNFFEVSQIGNYSVELTAEDEQGQVSRQWINQSVPDEYPPTTTTNLTSNTFYRTPVYVELNASDEESMIANLSYSIGGADYTTVQDSTATVEISGFGDHTLDFFAWDTAGNKESVKTEIISLEELEANFFFNPSEPFTGETVTFDGGTAQGNITQYEWDFTGDGTYDQTGEVVNHVYNDPGIKDVTLRVTDSDGNTDTFTDSVEVLYESENKSLINSCPDTPFCRNNGSNPVQISGSLTAEDGNQTFTYEVNATGNDGTYDFFSFYNSTSSRLSQTQYSDILNVTIASNETNIPPSADFTVSLSGLSVSTDASSSSDSDGTITDYRWDWTNDGTYEDTGLTASHTYPSNGEYTINLQVEDNNGSTDSLQKTVSVSETTDGGDDGGGGTPGGGNDNETDNPEVSVDGSSLQLLAPHRGTRYGEQSLQVSENESKTFFFYNEEHTIEVLDVEDSQNAEIVVDGIQREVTERDSFELERGTAAPYNIIEDVSVADIVDANNSKEVYFSVAGEPSPDVETPIGYQYQINESGMITLQYRRTGIDQDWVNATEQTFTESVEQNYTTFYQNLSSGIYEVRGILESNGNSSTTRATGVYIGEVPYLNVTNPEPGRVFTEVSNGAGGYTVPINFRAGTVNQTKFSLYYTDGSNIYAGATNVQITDDSDLVESFFESLGNLDYIANWFSYEWQNVDVIAPTDVTFTGSADVTVPTTGGYTGYVNASSNYSEVFEPWNATSIGVPVTVETTSVEDVPDSEVIDTFDPEDGDIARPPGSDENFSEDVNGSNFTNPQWRLVSPDQNAEIESARLDELSVEFDMLMGYEGTAAVNKTLTVENPSGEQVNINLNPSDSSYNDIAVSAAKWQYNEWAQGEYDWWLNYEFNDSIVYSTENKTNGEASFTVDRKRGPLESIRYFFDQLAETFADQLDTTKPLAATFLVMLMVIPTYVTVRYLVGDEIVAFLAAATVYSALAWVKLAPETLNFIILLIGLFYVVGKFTLWVVGSG